LVGGGGLQSEIWAFNASLDGDSWVMISATDKNCASNTLPLGGPGFEEFTLGPGQSMSVATLGDGSVSTEDYIFWLQAGLTDVSFELRVVQTDGGMDPVFRGTSQQAVAVNQVSDYDGDFPIPFFNILDGVDQRVVATNLTPVPQTSFGTLRSAADGAMVTDFQVSLQPFEIKSINLDELGLPGMSPVGVWKDGGDGVLMSLDILDGATNEIIMPAVAGAGPFATPLFRPDPDAMEYDPSELDMFVYRQDGEAIPSGTAATSEVQDCGPQSANENIFPFPAGQPFAPVFQDINAEQAMSGFADSVPNLPITVVWSEGGSQVSTQPQSPFQQGVVHLPGDSVFGGVPLPAHLLVKTEIGLRLPVAYFKANGELLGFKYLGVPAGSYLMCPDEIMFNKELDFIELRVPDGQPGNVWVSAIIDDPESDYKDQLPVHSVSGETRVGQFTKVLESWNGVKDTSCLANPNVLDIVDFMDNGLRCP